jgi:plasmid stabilization system protein ParE
MKRKVWWSETALDDFINQVTYIAQDNPQAARKVAARIQDAADGLGQQAIGRPGRVAGTYERVLSDVPYIIAYSLSSSASHEELVAILRIIHTSQEWPSSI